MSLDTTPTDQASDAFGDEAQPTTRTSIAVFVAFVISVLLLFVFALTTVAGSGGCGGG